MDLHFAKTCQDGISVKVLEGTDSSSTTVGADRPSADLFVMGTCLIDLNHVPASGRAS